jgi:hypothetical protein
MMVGLGIDKIFQGGPGDAGLTGRTPQWATVISNPKDRLQGSIDSHRVDTAGEEPQRK